MWLTFAVCEHLRRFVMRSPTNLFLCLVKFPFFSRRERNGIIIPVAYRILLHYQYANWSRTTVSSMAEQTECTF